MLPSGCQFFLLQHSSLGLTKQVLLETWVQNCEIIPTKRLFFKSQKITANGYYGIETLYQM